MDGEQIIFLNQFLRSKLFKEYSLLEVSMELKSRSIEKDDGFIPISRYPAWHDTMPRYDFFFSFFSSFFENPSPLSHVEHVAFLAKCSHHPWIPARYPRQNPEASGAEKNCQTVVTSATVCRWLMAVIFLRIRMTQGSVIQSSLYINTALLCVCVYVCVRVFVYVTKWKLDRDLHLRSLNIEFT